jgi:glycosyltransferase involved in cell wall biosynthesis
MKIVFLNYNILSQFRSPLEWIMKIAPSTGIMQILAEKAEIHYFIRIGYVGYHFHNGIHYHFMPRRVCGKLFPFNLHQAIKEIKPEAVIVFGLHFPFQILQLKRYIAPHTKIIAEHHANKPFGGIKILAQKIADNYIDAYHFTTIENAEEWINANLIKDRNKCKTISLASTNFIRKEKTTAKQITGMHHSINFLFVGRLNENKDPVSILLAFEKYAKKHSNAALHFIFQTNELLPELQKIISRNISLSSNVVLHGEKKYSELEIWYSAADFIISASHREGGSFVLIEAMACGCIPIVSNIPSSLKIINNGNAGLYFKAGNIISLHHALEQATALNTIEFSKKIENYFKENFSFRTIAEELYQHIS